MKILSKYKTVFGIVLFLIFILYVAFLFILPNTLNLNSYKKDIQKIIFDSSKIIFDADNMKIVTTPDLKAGVKISGLKILYPDNKEIFLSKSTEVKISLLPLIFKTLRISDITVDSPQLKLIYLKNCQLDLVDYLNKNLLSSADTQTASQELPLKISKKLPVVSVKNYNILLLDEKTGNKLSAYGSNFVLDKAVINKHLRITADGKFLVNNSENVNYDIKLFTFFPSISSNSASNYNSEMPQIDFINEIVKYNPKADIKTDIKIKKHDGHADINGFANIDKLSLVLEGEKLPDSYAHFRFNGHNTELDSNFCISDTEKASVLLNIRHNNNLKLDLNVKTDKLTFVSIQKFMAALLNSLNIKNDISCLILKGFINADFSVKTDLKKFESSGFFKISEGSVAHKTIPLKINNITADLDFSNNVLNIKNTGANINGSQISAAGKIDSKSYANISMQSENINLAPLYKAFAPDELKRAYPLKNGFLNVDVIVKGKLTEIQPDLNIILSDFLLGISGTPAKLSLSKAQLKMNPKDVEIIPFVLYLNSSKIDIKGCIKDYLNKPDVKVTAVGSVNSVELKNMLPSEVKDFVDAKGYIPLKAVVKGNGKKLEINAQALSDADRHFSPVIIKKMINQTGLINISMLYDNDRLNIADMSLYQTAKKSLDDDFVKMKKGAQKIAGLAGVINNLSSSEPELKIDFSMPEALFLSNSAMPDALLKIRADIDMFGALKSPMMKGFVSLNDIKLPDMLTNVRTADIELNNDSLNIKVQDLNINGSSMNLDMDAASEFNSIFLIKNMTLSSQLIDADKLFEAMEKMNKSMSQSAPVSSTTVKSPVAPVKILKGSAMIQKFKMKGTGADIEASDIYGNFNLSNDILKINNLKASVYNGTVCGKVDYNLASTALKAKINGKNIDANPAVTAFTGIKDQLMGKVNFDADVKLKGATYEQQMKTLNGKVNFSLTDGQMGSLGRFETFLKADNLISQTFVASKIGSLVSTVAPYNTGKFSYLDGELDIHNGNALLSPIKMSGPHMSLFITGNLNLLSMISNLSIMGNLSPEVISALGPVADLSVEKFAAYIPKFGTAIASAMNNYNSAANKSDLGKIPALTPGKENTKAFKVVLRGNLNNPPSTVKQFKWLNTQEKIQEEQESLLEEIKPKLPANKEELKQQVKEDLTNAIQQTETAKKIKENKAVQTFGAIYNFYKNNGKNEIQQEK
ncbi:MAG: AsmA family protein [Clostridium sp.]|nr:AsmA family protein [Clostridium sp.]